MIRTAIGLLLLAGSVAALATPYWIDWEGTDWPENQGWTRSWGNWNGPHQGGAYRTLEDGILAYDSMYDTGVYDYSYMYRPGQMDAGPGTLFVMEWRLKVDQNTDEFYGDPSVAFSSDEAWALGLSFTEAHIESAFEGFVTIPIIPHVWHDYRLTSTDMQTYDLYVDGTFAHHGMFAHIGFDGSYAGWGDGAQGIASLHHWDYFRFGTVVPEPCGFVTLHPSAIFSEISEISAI